MTAPSELDTINAELRLQLQHKALVADFAAFCLRVEQVQPLLDEACRIASVGSDASLSKVLKHLPDAGCFLMQAGIGWHPGVVGHATIGDGLDSPAGYAFRTGRAVIANHLDHETRFRMPPVLAEHGIKRAINVLIASPGFRYGVLEVDSPDHRQFVGTDSQFLQSLADMLASAIHRCEQVAQLRSNESFIRSMLEASPDCVKLLTTNGIVESINQNGVCALELTDASQVVGREWAMLWPEEQRATLRSAIDDALSDGIGSFDAFCPTAAGTPKWWEVIIRPFGHEARRERQLIVISRDITARVEASTAKDMLMLEVHHRVKNSLQLVQNLLMLQSRATDDGRAADQLLESAGRVRTIASIHDRLYRTGAEMTVDVAPYLEGLVDDLRAGMASALPGRSIQIEADAAIWPAAEVATLGIVLTELVTNALKYGKGVVQVRFVQSEQGSTLTVEDEGAGPDADFDPTPQPWSGYAACHQPVAWRGRGLADRTRRWPRPFRGQSARCENLCQRNRHTGELDDLPQFRQRPASRAGSRPAGVGRGVARGVD